MRHPIATQRVLCLATLLAPAAVLAEPAAAPAAATPAVSPAPAAAPTPAAESPELANEIARCLGGKQKTRRTIADLRDSAQACQRAWSALMARATVRAVALTRSPDVDAAALEAIKTEARNVSEELPAYPFGQSNWSLTIQAFLGLTRVTLGRRADGTVDQFAPLSGLGSGLKLRHSYVDAKDKARELVGLSAGLYYEPKVPVSGATGSNTAQTLSAMLVISTFEYLYLGVGLKFASTEPDFDRGLRARNFMLVFGLGADGKTLVN